MGKHDIHLQTGDMLKGRYQIVREIGSGGMSVVYLAIELGKDTFWAVKAADMNKKISKRLFSEAKILSELDHPGLPRIADFFSSEDGRYFFLVQEYIDGQPLLERFEQNDCRMEEEEVLDIGIAICDVLSFLHSQPAPIIYRDLKPANIMITEEGKIKLIDFGIARKYVQDQLKDTLQIGTVGFAAPEQFEKRQSDQRTDLFSLGALLYYLLSGGKYVYISQKPIEQFRKGLTVSLRKCIHSLVRTNPADRPKSAEAARDLLVKAKKELAAPPGLLASKEWLFIKYLISVSIFLGVILYIINDQLNH